MRTHPTTSGTYRHGLYPPRTYYGTPTQTTRDHPLPKPPQGPLHPAPFDMHSLSMTFLCQYFILQTLSMTGLSQCFILKTMSRACRIHIVDVRIHKQCAFIHIPLRDPPSKNMNPPQKLWQIHLRRWRIHDFQRLIPLWFMNATTINMNTSHFSLFLLPDSLLIVTYSCFLTESHRLLNEYGPFF